MKLEEAVKKLGADKQATGVRRLGWEPGRWLKPGELVPHEEGQKTDWFLFYGVKPGLVYYFDGAELCGPVPEAELKPGTHNDGYSNGYKAGVDAGKRASKCDPHDYLLANEYARGVKDGRRNGNKEGFKRGQEEALTALQDLILKRAKIV